MRVRKTRAELRREQRAAEAEDQRLQQQLRDPRRSEAESKAAENERTSAWREGVLPVLGAYVGLCAIWLLVLAVAWGLMALHLGWVFIVLLAVDICGHFMYKDPRPRKYLPILWMFR
jgi:Flp pilus assembly protein TadB